MAMRLAVVWALVLGAAVGLSSWIAYRAARDQLLDNLTQSVSQDSRVMALRLETWMRTFQDDARSTSQSPILARFLRARLSQEESLWRQMAEDEFRAAFAGKSAYFQMRLLHIGGEEDGREILRLDRQDGNLLVTAPDRLQKKAGRSYYQEALTVPTDAIYLSKINLNRDFGGITEPHIPTIRAATRIESVGTPPAMLIINADLRPLFEELRQLTSPATETRLADASGDFLMHPRPEFRFATDLGHEHRFTSIPSHDDEPLALPSTVTFSSWPTRTLTLLVSIPRETWQSVLSQSTRRGLWATMLATMGGALLAALLSLPFTRRLGRLSSALRQFDASEMTDTTILSDSRQDEIGVAISRFREMATNVRQHVDDLRAARDEAHEANEAKETFLAVMSHEIRTPMNAVVGLIRALEKNHPAAHQQPILASLKASSTNLMTLLNTALDYTRLREGVIAYGSEIFDAAAVAREVAEALTPSALAKQLELRHDLPDTLLVLGDPVRFRQVINNLLNNAIKFTERGHVRLTLKHTSERLQCTVADTGPGIAPEDHERIFTPFFTGASSAHNALGAGLGLSVSKQLIEQQGGKLTLHSALQEGATFTVTLPYARQTEAPTPSPAPTLPKPRLRKGLKILYVEDVASNQEVMAIVLDDSGVELHCVDTAAEALARVNHESFDLVMVDLQLPDMAGDILASEILTESPQTPIIAVTAQSSAKTDRRIREAGIAAVLLKPFSEESVLQIIREHTGFEWNHALAALHPHDRKRQAQLARTMAGEFRTAAGQVRALQKRRDWETIVRELRPIRHKLTTALAQFQLASLQSSFDQLIQSSAGERDRLENIARELLNVAEALQTQAPPSS